MRTLGDVPAPDAVLTRTDEILPGTASVLEVNGVGEITADGVGLGDVSTWGSGDGESGDPFAFRIGDVESFGGENDPQAKLYMPTHPADSGSAYSAPITTPSGDTYIGPSGDFDAEQLANAAAIMTAGQEVGATDRDIQIALMVGLVESNLHNVDHGDRDSIGVFQQRDAWGSTEDRMNVAKSAEMFFLGGQAGQQGLLDIPDREKRDMGDLAQDVQVSAFPTRYAERTREAEAVIGAVLGGGSGTETKRQYKGKNPYDTLTRDGETVDYMTSAALDAAIEDFGGEMPLMQGGHSHYHASGNTHAGLGVLDLDVPNGDWAGAMESLRKIGFAAWVRNVPGYGYAGDGAHIHAVLIGNEELSPQAQVQVQSYLNNDDGLKGSRPDDGPRQYVNNRFVWGRPLKERERWRDGIVKRAEQFLGTGFKYGGEDITGADDAGFVRQVYSELGVELPRTSYDLAFASDPVEKDDLKPGDLVTWDKHPTLRSDHIGVYVGNGRYVEGRPGGVFQVSLLGDEDDVRGVSLSALMKPDGHYPKAGPTGAALAEDEDSPLDALTFESPFSRSTDRDQGAPGSPSPTTYSPSQQAAAASGSQSAKGAISDAADAVRDFLGSGSSKPSKPKKPAQPKPSKPRPVGTGFGPQATL